MHFGALRVIDDAARMLSLRNGGRYEFAYRVVIASQAVADLVTVTPMEGALAPGKEAAITVRRRAAGMQLRAPACASKQSLRVCRSSHAPNAMPSPSTKGALEQGAHASLRGGA